MILNDTVRQALTAGHLAHLVTLNKDGSPHVSIIWVGLDGDEIVSGHLKLHKKLENIQRHARVALSMVTGGKSNGLDNYLVINGLVRVTESGAPRLLNRSRSADLYRLWGNIPSFRITTGIHYSHY